MFLGFRASTVECLKSFCIKTVDVLILLTIFDVCSAVRTAGVDGVPKEAALHRLLKVFGMDQPGKKHHHLPPQYMLDLYNTIADDTGITRTVHPYRANIVRSFPDKDVGHPQRFYFNITSLSIPAYEEVLEAEFHLYRMRHREERIQENMYPLLEVRIYQVMFTNTSLTERYNRLLDVRKISVHSSGWEVFHVKRAVIDWLKNPETNFGLLVTVRNLFGESVAFQLAKFAKRHHHHVNKKPILVVFTDDGRKTMPGPLVNPHSEAEIIGEGIANSTQTNTGDNPPILPAIKSSTDTVRGNYSGRSRNERALADSREITSHSGCTRHELQVDFEKIGWSSWIISPKYYNAYFCKGNCEFPLGQNQWPTNHATVQSIVHELNLYPELQTPCCVPSKLYSINLLYFDEYENVILKQYDDMVAASCGCH